MRQLRQSLLSFFFIFTICLQGTNWDCEPEGNISQNWARSFSRIAELFRSLRCQLICSELPLDLVLCVACNSIWWVLMKVDPLNQHFCQREALDIAIYSLKTGKVLLLYFTFDIKCFSFLMICIFFPIPKLVEKTLGNSPWIFQPTGHIDSDFIQLSKISSENLLKLTPIQCQLAIEIIIFGLITILDSNQPLPFSGYQQVVDKIVDLLPLIKVHFTLGKCFTICC